jgi:N-acyl amino acid synthase of PEP-CTERM/exosortase system
MRRAVAVGGLLVFDRHFEAFLADTEPARETHFRLRYQVYCRDQGWEDTLRFPDQKECDEFDVSSTPFLVRRRRSKGWIATMRLIRLPLEELPVSRYVTLPAGRLPGSARDRMVEFSRLCVVKKYRRAPRRRISGEIPDFRVPSDLDDSFLASGYRASESWIFLGLVRAGWQWSLGNGVDFWMFFIADALARVIQRSGFEIEPMGDEVEHRGLRRPYLVDLERSMSRMRRENKVPEVAEMFHHQPAYREFSELHEASMGVRRGTR